MKKSVSSSKQVLAVFLAVLLSVLSVLLPSEVPESDIIIQASATDDMHSVFEQFDFNLNTYMANILTTVNNPKYKQLQYRLTEDSPATVLARAFNDDDKFVKSVKKWKKATFSVGEMPKQDISEVDYYDLNP